MRLYRLVAEADDADALWVNPAGLGMRSGFSLFSQRSQSDSDDLLFGSATSQRVWGARFGGLGLGYRHDEFPVPERTVRAQGDAYSIGLGVGREAVALGAAYTWHRVGPHASAWDLGALVRPASWLSVGVSWRDLGSPVVGGVRQDERVVAGLALRPFGTLLTATAESELDTRGGDAVQHRAGVRVLAPHGLEAFALLDFDRDVDLQNYSFGVRARLHKSDVHALWRRPDNGGPERWAVSSLSFSDVNPKPFLSRARIARLMLSGAYVDYPPPGFALFGSSDKGAQPLVLALRQAREDETIRGLLLKIRPLSGAFAGPITAVHQELRAEVEALRRAGKPVVAYLDTDFGAAELYLASAADEVIAPRLATPFLVGINFELQRLKRTFEKFGIEWDATTAGQYKSTFHTQYTDTSTAAQRAWIDGLVERAFTELVDGIAAGRRLSADSLRRLIDAPPLSAEAARAAGLIDRIGTEEDAEKRIRERVGSKLPFRPLRPVQVRSERWGTPPTVVVVYAAGGIVPGLSRRDPIWGDATMGSETVARQLRRAASVPGVKAVVLRVNSGGGSAVASDEIRAAVDWLRSEKKLPVIASMGNVAASGGYWISMKADTIVADPLTVTGSIGVVFAIPVIEELLEKLRVTNERWTRGRYAGAESVTRHRTPEEMALIDRFVGDVYDVFIAEVAEGRGLPADSVREDLAEGRVWFGRDAQRVGLVDELGGLARAVEIAAARGGIDGSYRVVRVRDARRPLRWITESAAVAARGLW